MKTKLKDLGFTSGHAYLLVGAVTFFSVLMIAQSDINVKALFAKADDTEKLLTYEEVRNQVIAEQGSVASSVDDEEAKKQLALLDPSLDDGKVLGEAIGIGAIPQVESIFTREQLDQVPVRTTQTTVESIQKYSEHLIGAEAQFDALSIMSDMNSSDATTLRAAKEKSDALILELASITAPTELVDYHRYKMLYYKTLSDIAEYFANDDLNVDFQNTSKILFSLTNKMDQIKSKIYNSYGVSL